MIITDYNAIVVLNANVNNYIISIAASRVLGACMDVNSNRSSTTTTAASANITEASTTITTEVIIIIEAAMVIIQIVAIINDGAWVR